ncbi:MAG: 50S ribosomal protein L28 [Elusimicrobia bacterium]|nr:50S ribosomal protein L28 [Elusimicrobiota bacterium]OGR55305.1 MAG: 50S ribosomal protein L28 [Elusimicrobia bacterium GWA2_38_7]OGR79501.1 MAG: 50S ribosomal protein L28 [Elusimicrobia bacterium RIFCSPHIGHO2_02_FULL_39_36]OGR99611.1 MAG: 50S ribosomal protein L28 [Elusimicrobia bacterium RIFCSPLOWO2_12_FULL_39_28]
MSFRCDVCDKGPSAGKTVSHSHRATNRRFLPNLQKVKVNLSGTVRRIYVCTSCLKSGKVKKAS